ncbi:MAG TPA: hypothetical protein VGP82_15875, partial [Ktedonobacterales bacterium]|nr:hypothetical protein [Ktedonobacterales bacterium]
GALMPEHDAQDKAHRVWWNAGENERLSACARRWAPGVGTVLAAMWSSGRKDVCREGLTHS